MKSHKHLLQQQAEEIEYKISDQKSHIAPKQIISKYHEKNNNAIM